MRNKIKDISWSEFKKILKPFSESEIKHMEQEREKLAISLKKNIKYLLKVYEITGVKFNIIKEKYSRKCVIELSIIERSKK